MEFEQWLFGYCILSVLLLSLLSVHISTSDCDAISLKMIAHIPSAFHQFDWISCNRFFFLFFFFSLYVFFFFFFFLLIKCKFQLDNSLTTFTVWCKGNRISTFFWHCLSHVVNVRNYAKECVWIRNMCTSGDIYSAPTFFFLFLNVLVISCCEYVGVSTTQEIDLMMTFWWCANVRKFKIKGSDQQKIWHHVRSECGGETEMEIEIWGTSEERYIEAER